MSEFEIKAKYKSELAADYNISIQMLKSWIDQLPDDIKKESKIKFGKSMLTPNQVKVLVEFWGNP